MAQRKATRAPRLVLLKNPTPVLPTRAREALSVAPLIEKIGRRKCRVFYVSRLDAAREDADYVEAGWYVDAVNPDPLWLNNDALGPYTTPEEALADVRRGCRSDAD